MGDGYTDFIISLLENRIRDLRLRLDRSKYPVFEDEKLTTAEVASIEAEIKHWKLELKLMDIEYDF
jgi:hypothetical protein